MKKLFTGITIALLLTGCSKGEEKAKEETPTATEAKEGETKQEETTNDPVVLSNKELPKTLEEMATYPVGKYGKLSDKEMLEKVAQEKAGDEILQLAEEQKVSALSAEEQKKWYISSLFSLTKRELKLYDKTFNPGVSSTPISEEDKKKIGKENFNVEILIDASGSMAGKVDGQEKMSAAKKAIETFASTLPKEANVSLTVYGHKGSNEEKDKELSCGQIETVYERQVYDEAKFKSSLNNFKPTGWTPLASALDKALTNFSTLPGDKNANVLYVVSDGIETCGGNPVEAAKKIGGSTVQPVVNIIGFDVDDEAQKQLKQVAEEAKGKYISVRNVEELESEIQKGKDLSLEWSNWKTNNSWEVFASATETIFELNQLENRWRHEIDFLQHSFIQNLIAYMRDNDMGFKEITSSVENELGDYLRDFKDNVILKRFTEMRENVDKKEKEKLKEIESTHKNNN